MDELTLKKILYKCNNSVIQNIKKGTWDDCI